jgi:cell division protein FtsX
MRFLKVKKSRTIAIDKRAKKPEKAIISSKIEMFSGVSKMRMLLLV